MSLEVGRLEAKSIPGVRVALDGIGLKWCQLILSAHSLSLRGYVCELIRADQRRKAEERIDALLLDGLDSGEPIPATAEYWEGKKRKLAGCLGKVTGQSG